MKHVLVFLCLQVWLCAALAQAEGVDKGSRVRTAPISKLSKIVFTKDWKEIVHGSLEPGKDVRIEYNATRLPNRDTRYGQRAWDIFAEFKYSEAGKVHTQRLEGPDKQEIMTTTLKIPNNAKTVIIWFKHHGYYNGYSYDSNFGKNYRFPITKIIFTKDWREYVEGSLVPGGQFQVVYDSVRLPWRDIGYLGLGYAWNIFANAQFSKDGPVVEQMLQGGNQGGNPIMTTIYDIPKDAKEVILWFFFTGYVHTRKWDSNHGKNYRFLLSSK